MHRHHRRWDQEGSVDAEADRDLLGVHRIDRLGRRGRRRPRVGSEGDVGHHVEQRRRHVDARLEHVQADGVACHAERAAEPPLKRDCVEAVGATRAG